MIKDKLLSVKCVECDTEMNPLGFVFDWNADGKELVKVCEVFQFYSPEKINRVRLHLHLFTWSDSVVTLHLIGESTEKYTYLPYSKSFEDFLIRKIPLSMISNALNNLTDERVEERKLLFSLYKRKQGNEVA